jgi:hypothetical protein
MNARPADPIHGGPLTPLIMAMLDKDPASCTLIARREGLHLGVRNTDRGSGYPAARRPSDDDDRQAHGLGTLSRAAW